MIRTTSFLFVLLVVCTSAYAANMPEPRTVRVNDRVHILLGPIQHANKDNQGYMINSTVIIGDRGVVLVDPGGTHEVGLHVAKAVRRITSKPVTQEQKGSGSNKFEIPIEVKLTDFAVGKSRQH